MIEPRIDPIRPEDRTDEHRRLLEPVFGERPVPNVFATVLNNVELYEAWMPFVMKLLQRSAFHRRERELVILRVAHLCQTDYEWHHHVAIGLRAGLTEDEIEGLTAEEPSGWHDRDLALLRATDQLVRAHTLDDAAWDALVAVGLTTDQLVELPMLAGSYALLAGALNAFRVSADEPAGGAPNTAPASEGN